MSKKQFRQRLARLLEIQNSHGLSGNWDQSKYMLGLYNGIELSLAIPRPLKVNAKASSTPPTSAIEQVIADNIKGK
jgi:hypothetical protein